MNPKKVYVGLSGGVDSSVAALLLKKAGHEVTGVFIRGWQPDWIPCTWKEDRISAMRTAAYLDIPFLTVDLEQEYKEKVVNYILSEYSSGNTPNPDMLCNREIKFGAFLKWALEHGADYVATGHYATTSTGKSGEARLMESKDSEKDQTYFLSQLTQKQLSNTLFPIGHLEKRQVRKIATEAGLPVATRKDSQGICFVGELQMADFLKKELSPEPGKVILASGEVVGEHDGAVIYTIGQKHGFRITNNDFRNKDLYICKKNLAENTITVDESSTEPSTEQNGRSVTLRNFSFTRNIDLATENILLRIRYRGELLPAKTVSRDNDQLELELDSPQSYAAGQFGVLYTDQGECLGGGTFV